MICGLFQNQASTSGTLPSNTIPNPKGEMKAITTRSGVAYEGPSIPTNPSPKKVVERETEETTDKEQTNFQGSTAQIPPPVIPISIPEPDVPKTLPKTTPIPESDIPKSLPKPNIPYPSRRDDQKSRDKASNQMEKIFQIFQDLRFDISFADALLLMPRFAPTIKSLLMNKEKLLELAKIPLNENCSAVDVPRSKANPEPPRKGMKKLLFKPEINADHVEIKTNLLQLVQVNPFYGRENDNPHGHINSFKRITSTLRFRNVPNDVIKLMIAYAQRSNYPENSNVHNSKTSRRQVSNIVELEIRTIVVPMQNVHGRSYSVPPTKGKWKAIVLPEINADHFEIKTNLLQLVQANLFYGRENDNPHAHINSFKRITSTL
ncbi:hypothetical protein Tco_1384560 [Tanacetum coccineum]